MVVDISVSVCQFASLINKEVYRIFLKRNIFLNEIIQNLVFDFANVSTSKNVEFKVLAS